MTPIASSNLPINSLQFIFYTALIAHILLTFKVLVPFFRKKTGTYSGEKPPISVIVCAHNESENLRKLLPKLLFQNYPTFEVIVSLDRCTDDSKSYLQNLADPRIHIIEINTVPDGWNPKKYGLTQAIDQAQNEWLVFTDADCQPTSVNWLEQYAKTINDQTDLILGVGAYTEEPHLTSQLTNYETFQTALHYNSAALRNKAYMGVGRNMAYRKSVFKKIKGFTPFENVTGGDDDLLVQKMTQPGNTQIILGKESLTYSIPKRTWKGYLSQKTRHLSVGKYYQPKAKRNHIIRSVVHITLWVSFLYLLFFFPSPTRIIVSFGLLVVVKGLFFKKISSKLGLPFQMAQFPLMDLVYAIFLPLLGVRANYVKSIRWKN